MVLEPRLFVISCPCDLGFSLGEWWAIICCGIHRSNPICCRAHKPLWVLLYPYLPSHLFKIIYWEKNIQNSLCWGKQVIANNCRQLCGAHPRSGFPQNFPCPVAHHRGLSVKISALIEDLSVKISALSDSIIEDLSVRISALSGFGSFQKVHFQRPGQPPCHLQIRTQQHMVSLLQLTLLTHLILLLKFSPSLQSSFVRWCYHLAQGLQLPWLQQQPCLPLPLLPTGNKTVPWIFVA